MGDMRVGIQENRLRTSETGGLVEKNSADKCLEKLIQEYRKTKEPLQVDFRKMVDWVRYGERASHMIHLYPAKLLPHIPILFLSNNVLSTEGDTVFDPFCGSGTVLLEAILCGRKSVGADSNPLARLITEVKTRPLDFGRLRATYKRLLSRIEKTTPVDTYPDVVNIDRWFLPHVKEQLNHIIGSIDVVKNKEIRDFFYVAFSNTVKRVSLADPKVSVPVRLNKNRYEKGSRHYLQTEKIINKINNIDVYEIFRKITEANIERIKTLNELVDPSVVGVKVFDDARSLHKNGWKQPDESVKLIVTSPPYAGAQKYIRSSSLNLGWLGMCKSGELRKFEKENIGREHYSKNEYHSTPVTNVASADRLLSQIYKVNPLRAYIAANYLLEMSEAVKEAYRVLKYDGYFVLVIANNKVCGKDFITQQYMREIIESYGMNLELCLVDDIHSRGLMTKRNKAANVISSEWIMMFKKVRDHV